MQVHTHTSGVTPCQTHLLWSLEADPAEGGPHSTVQAAPQGVPILSLPFTEVIRRGAAHQRHGLLSFSPRDPPLFLRGAPGASSSSSRSSPRSPSPSMQSVVVGSLQAEGLVSTVHGRKRRRRGRRGRWGSPQKEDLQVIEQHAAAALEESLVAQHLSGDQQSVATVPEKDRRR